MADDNTTLTIFNTHNLEALRRILDDYGDMTLSNYDKTCILHGTGGPCLPVLESVEERALEGGDLAEVCGAPHLPNSQEGEGEGVVLLTGQVTHNPRMQTSMSFKQIFLA